MVIGRFDIIQHISVLSSHAARPAPCHFVALKQIWRWLRHTKDRGLLYWRLRPRDELPIGHDKPEASIDPDFPHPASPFLLGMYTDSAYATDPLTRRSTGGRICTIGGTAVLAKAKFLPVLATSISESELMEAVHGAKDIIYLRSILAGLGCPQSNATDLYADNAAAIMVANNQKPTPRTRHMDIRWFAIQHWVELGLVVLRHIPGILNIADTCTKTLGRLLHGRHCRQMMGHNGSPCSSPPSS